MCTLEKRGNLFFLTLTGDDDHRLNPTLIGSIRAALAEAKSQSTPGCALVTSAHGKFFSNGFDIAWAQAAGARPAVEKRISEMVNGLKPLIADLFSLPMPTIAAVTGHASAAGLLLALSHDYVLMRKDRGVAYMSELDLGLTLPEYFTHTLRAKIGTAAGLRDAVLGAAKLRAEEAVRLGIVDSAHDSGESTVEAAVRLAEKLAARKWDGNVYAELRKSLYPEACGTLGLAWKEMPNFSRL